MLQLTPQHRLLVALNPRLYVGFIVGGVLIFSIILLIIHALKKTQWHPEPRKHTNNSCSSY